MFSSEPSRAFQAQNSHCSVQKEPKQLLTTKEVAALTGFSTSYFEKARIYDYGPAFLRVQSLGKTGKILYRRAAVESWLSAQECSPKGLNHVK